MELSHLSTESLKDVDLSLTDVEDHTLHDLSSVDTAHRYLNKNSDSHSTYPPFNMDVLDHSIKGDFTHKAEPCGSDYTGDAETTFGSDAPTVVYKSYKRRWFGIVALVLMNIVSSWGWLTFAAISNLVVDKFSLKSEAPVNWLSTVILFAFCLTPPAVSWVLHKYNVRGALFVASAFVICGNWVRYAGSKTNNFGAVMFGQILIGFGQPFALGAPSYFTDQWFTSKSRVTANALASLSNPLGGAIAQLVGPAMVAADPTQFDMFILVTAIVSTVAAASCLLVPKEPPSPPCPSATIEKLSLKDSLFKLVKSRYFVTVFFPFAIYVGFFNAFSTFVNQIMLPYGYSEDNAGIAGALLIFVGIVFTLAISPVIDRFHFHLWLIRICVPIIAACYIGAIFMCTKDGDAQLAGPFVVCAVLGAASFSLLPTFLELIPEQTSPVSPAVSSNILWVGGQFFGAIFIIIMNALKDNETTGDPPGNMRRAMIFQAVIACVGVIPTAFIPALPSSRINMDAKR